MTKIILISLLLTLASCATTRWKQLQETPTDIYKHELNGSKGVLRELPRTRFIMDSDKSPDMKDIKFTNFISDYNSCEPVTIIKSLYIGYGDEKQIGLEDLYFWVSQGDKHFIIQLPNYASVLSLKHMSKSSIMTEGKELPFKSRKIRLKSGSKNSKELLCSGGIFTSMTKNELLFVKGKPDRINRTTTRSNQREQWVYGKSYYYFINDSLNSWQD